MGTGAHTPTMYTAQNFHSGIAAEELAARAYRTGGGHVRATRWRCPEGELDMVVELAGEIVFVEVKARRRHDPGAVTERQWARIAAAATRYLAEQTDGTRPYRFDLALVDRFGRLERIENARSFDGWQPAGVRRGSGDLFSRSAGRTCPEPATPCCKLSPTGRDSPPTAGRRVRSRGRR